jgi:pimeloyl-ACP methyl ester carboxylesterase
VLFLHGIGNSGDAWKTVIQDLPSDIRVVVIDLLGFGKSPSPSWAIYNAKTQAKSVAATFLKLGITQPAIIVGHSLGALVAVEAAKRYPFAIRSLILCSPPFYKADEERRRLVPRYDSLLKQIYSLAKRHPRKFVAISQLAVRLGLVNSSYNVTHENTPIYMNALNDAGRRRKTHHSYPYFIWSIRPSNHLFKLALAGKKQPAYHSKGYFSGT